MSASSTAAAVPAKTPLYALNVELGAKMVPFAGYAMPVQFPAGILAEHLHTRSKAGLFDVSHMGQAVLRAGGGHEGVAKALERLVPGDLVALKPGQMRYTLLLNETGGIIDDLMVMRPVEPEGEGVLFLVVNAACKAGDFAHIAEQLSGLARLDILEDAALLALQGPMAHQVLARHCPQADKLGRMHGAGLVVGGAQCLVTRSGYTGEDGFEISIHAPRVEALARLLLAEPEVAPIGLGARDSLRLEAGLCLYGHDIDETTSPIEAGLTWTIGKRRKMARDFPGAERVMRELFEGVSRKRVGIRPEGKAPAREGVAITDKQGRPIGRITSGGFGPSVGGPIAMGYVEPGFAEDGTLIDLLVRDAARPARITPLPFIPPHTLGAKE
jgi:aminomethyltransferase